MRLKPVAVPGSVEDRDNGVIVPSPISVKIGHEIQTPKATEISCILVPAEFLDPLLYSVDGFQLF